MNPIQKNTKITELKPDMADGFDSSSSKGSVGRYPDIDGLRGIAIIGVLCAHLLSGLSENHSIPVVGFLLQSVSFGWAGVDLFFVLSGFLISSILMDMKGESSRWKTFYLRRTYRIFPLYYLALAVIAVAALIGIFPSDKWDKLAPAYPYFLTYTNNFLIVINEGNYFPGLSHFWTLAIEEQFYLLWPAVIFLLPIRTVLYICFASIIVCFSFRVALANGFLESSAWPHALHVLMPLRSDSLCTGCLVAIMIRDTDCDLISAKFKKAFLAMGAMAGIGLIAILSVFWGSVGLPNYLLFSFNTIAFGALIYYVRACRVPDWIMRPLCLAPLRFIGFYSYGIYVWHAIINNLMGRRQSSREWLDNAVLSQLLFIAIVLFLTAIATFLSWRLVEKPFLKLRPKD
jgi:peptidoglycan/LPS O-acetylase OafA/YrhL